MRELHKYPLLYFTILLLGLSYYVNFQDEKWETNIIHSDGIGYYYYLPTFFNGDFTFQKTREAEKNYFGENKRNDILIKTDQHHFINKYAPGVAILLLPFYLLAYFISFLLSGDLSGYSPIFFGCLYAGSICYALIGVFLLKKLLSEFFDDQKIIWISIFAIYFGTNLVYLSLANSTFTHHYSFFLMVLFCYLVVRYSKEKKPLLVLSLGFTLGLIFLVRPPNLLILFFIPFLLQTKKNLLENLTYFFSQKTHLWYFAVPFLILAFLYFRLVKLQTGSWFYWSYAGEGFNFVEPHFFASLFSYQAGILLHFPVLLLSLFGWYFGFKKSSYVFFTWLLFFVLVVYIVSSWWCWDYKYSFGNRAYTEYYFLFCFPLIYLLQNGRKKVVYSFLFCSIVFFGIRFYQKVEKIVPDQKFTSSTFWRSAFDLKKSDIKKYNFTKTIPPFGKMLYKKQIQVSEQDVLFTSQKEFGCTALFKFPQKRLQNKFYFEIEFEKKFPETVDNTDITIVFDGVNKKTGVRNYYSNPIYEYYQEAQNTWKKTFCSEIIGAIADSLDEVSIYIWNQKKKNFQIKNYTLTVSEYQF